MQKPKITRETHGLNAEGWYGRMLERVRRPQPRTCEELVDRQLPVSIPICILEPLKHLFTSVDLTYFYWLHLDELFEIESHLPIVIYEVAER
jgi:hypothetical protein